VKLVKEFALSSENVTGTQRTVRKPVFESFKHSDIHICTDCLRNSAFWVL